MPLDDRAVLLDTCAWLFWHHDRRSASPADARLSFEARDAIDAADATGSIIVSSASVWEIAVKHAAGRLDLDDTAEGWLNDAMAEPTVQMLDMKPEDLISSTLLPDWQHRDPFDRIIVATACRLGVPVVTSDATIRSYRHVRSIW